MRASYAMAAAVLYLLTRAETAGAQGRSAPMGPATDPRDAWRFEFRGYFRAPMRVGIGERATTRPDGTRTSLCTT